MATLDEGSEATLLSWTERLRAINNTCLNSRQVMYDGRFRCYQAINLQAARRTIISRKDKAKFSLILGADVYREGISNTPTEESSKYKPNRSAVHCLRFIIALRANPIRVTPKHKSTVAQSLPGPPLVASSGSRTTRPSPSS